MPTLTRPRADRTRPTRWFSALTAMALALLGVVVVAPAAQAAGTPDLAVTVAGPGEALQGAPFDVTLSAQSLDAVTDGYNLTFTLTLPAEATVTSTPAPVLDVVNGAVRTVVWENVSDLLAGTTSALTVTIDPNNLPLGAVALNAHGYTNADPRFIPDYDGAGTVTGDYTADDAGSGTVTLVPFTITKDLQTEEKELLRGVHDQRAAVLLTLRNNLIDTSTAMTITDYIPAELEFLGCGAAGDDNSAADEYAGSGPLNASPFALGATPCPVPSFVDTQTLDPDGAGPMPNAVYTVVTWTTADLGAAGVLSTAEVAELQYVVGIPQFRNTDTFPGGIDTTGSQGSNLDNNTGSTTAEGFDGSVVEQAATNLAVLSGTYDDPFSAAPLSHTDSDTDTVTLEDISIHKTASRGDIVQGTSTTWTLLVETSEYVTSADGITVTDTVPDGLLVTGTNPAAASITTAVEGTVVVWDLAAFEPMGRSDSVNLTLTTVVEETYSDGADGGEPVRANDAWDNTVALTADSVVDSDPAVGDRNLVDDSAASQVATGIVLKKYVAAPTAAGLCGDGSALTWYDDIEPTEFGPGDVVCWRLVMDTPSGLDTSALVLRDFLPAGYESLGSQTASDSDLTFPATASGLTSVTWDLSGAVGDLDESSRGSVILRSRIVDPMAATSVDIVENLAKLIYANTADEVFQLREQADADWTEPELAIDKSASTAGPVRGGDTITYTVEVTNNGDLTAENVQVRDLLPTVLACADITSGYTVTGGAASVPFGCASDIVSGTVTAIAPGDTVSISYQVLIPTTVAPGTTLTNTAGVRSYTADTNDPGAPTFTYIPSNNIDPTQNPIANTDPVRDAVSLPVVAASVVKAVTTDIVTTPDNTATEVAVGEWATYTVTATLPANTTVTDATLTDPVSARLGIGTGADAPSAVSSAGTTLTTSVAGQTITVDIADHTVGAVAETITLTYRAQLLNLTGSNAGVTVPNTATLSWDNGSGSAVTTQNVAGSGTLTIVEPLMGLTKNGVDDSGDNAAQPGELIDYTLVVTNTVGGSVSIGYDTVVVDDVPNTMVPVDSGGTPIPVGGTVDGTGVWDGNLITWSLGDLPAGATGTRTLSYTLRVLDELPVPSTYTNTAVVTTTSLPGAGGAQERTATSVPTRGRYTATASDTFTAPAPLIDKSVSPTSGTVGDQVTYTIAVTIPANTTTFDATVLDSLPTGMTYLATSSAACTAPVGCGLTVEPALVSGQNLAWFLGDLQTASPVDQVVTIVYTARIADVPAAVDGATLTNTATIGYNASDTIVGSPAAPPSAASFDATVSDTAAVGVLEPDVTLTKTVDDGGSDVHARRVLPGETVTYSITLTNGGTSTAYDVLVDDTTDPRFGTVTNVTGATAVDSDASGDGGLQFTVASIAVGASVTITYDAVVPALVPGDEQVGAELTNTAEAGYSSLPGDQPGVERTYTSNDDTVGLETDLAAVGDRVWWDVDGDGVQDAGEPGVGGVDLTITCVGPDGVGAAPDETFFATTAADGSWGVANLPACDDVVVTVDPASLPAGFEVTVDRDGAVDGLGTASAPLAGGDTDLAFDFGIRGAAEIGDLVWYDQDADGTQDAGGAEPGLAGIGVTVTLCGLDGLPGTADDISLTTTTAADGSWGIAGVPDGCFTVTLDPATFPPGVAPVSDPDGGTADGVASGTMAGTDDLTFDFGLRGDGRLGDRVWLDADEDGVQDAVGDEPGISGATVQVSCTMPNGGAPVVLDVSTGANGAYLADHLPFSTCTVAVTSLPVALAPTFDEDSGTTAPNGQTVVILTSGSPEHLTADFGYVADTGVGDTVWLDLNSDGVQDAGEPGLAGVEVTVTSGGPDGLLSTTGDNLVVVTTTDGVGYYQVVGLPPGETLVEVTGGLPSGVSQTYDADGLGTADASQTSLVLNVFDPDQDFGYVGPNSIGDFVWLDLDADGVQDAGEPGLAGVGVDVTWFGQDGVEGTADDLVLHATTDADGLYLVDGLPDGDYSVVISSGVPAGWAASFDETGPADGMSVVTELGAGGPEDYETADFGFTGTGRLCGTVWLDRVADGVLSEPSEAALPGIGVDVTWSGPDGVLGTADDVVFRATTDADGGWCVQHMPPGPFQAAVDETTLPPGTTVVFDQDSGLASPDGVITGTLAPNEIRTDVDAAVRGTSSFGDLVWVDQNRNGTRDSGEPGADGVRVTATCLGADGVVGGGDDWTIVTTTAGGGSYLMDGLPGCEYRVVFDTFPSGTEAYSDLDGGDPTVTAVDLGVGEALTDVDVVLRPSGLAATGAAIGGLLALALLLTAGGVYLRLRSSRMKASV